MNISNILSSFKTDLYLTRFRINHNDYYLKLKLKFCIILLVIITIPLLYILFKSLLLNRLISKENYIIETNSLKDTNTYDMLITPLDGKITSDYGYRTDPISGKYSKHTGIDISDKHHDNIKCITDGIVTFSGSQNGFGNCVEIKHNINGEEIYSFYAHLSNIYVNINQKVNAGQTIGREGGDPKTDPNPRIYYWSPLTL